MRKENSTTVDTRQVLIKRSFDAPPELVFELWSEARHLTNWYAPKGCTVEIRKFDFRVGGSFHLCIQDPVHGGCWTKGEFREIIPGEKIVYDLRFADPKGNDVVEAAPLKDINWPQATLVTVTFEEEDGKTLLTLHQTVDKAVAILTGAYPSWLEMLDRLKDELKLVSIS